MSSSLKQLYRALRTELSTEGFVVEEKGRDHPKVTHPNKRGVVFLASTPSDIRTYKNDLSQLNYTFGWRPASRRR